MRVLVVEDSPEELHEIVEFLKGLDPPPGIVGVATLEEASEAIRAAWFDVVVCDLQIPLDSDGEARVEHGLALRARIAEAAPGTPLILFSAHHSPEMMGELHRVTAHGDPFGERVEVPLLDFFDKRDLLELTQRLGSYHRSASTLEGIEFDDGGLAIELEEQQKRAIAIYANRRGGTFVRIVQTYAGHSRAKVLALRVEAPDGSEVAYAVSKYNSRAYVQDEGMRYREHVASRLPPGSFAPLADTVDCGAGDRGSLYYSVAADSVSLFEWVRTHGDNGADVVAALRESLNGWSRGSTAAELVVGDVRRRLVSDSYMPRLTTGLSPDELSRVEATRVHVRVCTQHLDLHGGNVLITSDGRPQIIDYAASASDSVASLDPVTLELSFAFHPGAEELTGGWPSLEQADGWDDQATWSVGFPAPLVLEHCRRWAGEVGRGQRERFASAYAYLVRQLRYTTGDKQRLAQRMIARTAELLHR